MKTITKKPRNTKPRVTKTETKPISIVLQYNGQNHAIETDNVLNALKSLEIIPNSIKTRVVLHVTKGLKTETRFFTPYLFKMTLMKDLNKLILAKFFNERLGIEATYG